MTRRSLPARLRTESTGTSSTHDTISEIREEVKKYQMPYDLSISAGYDELMGDQDQIRNCIQRTDKKLYLDKEYRKLRPTA